MHQMVCLTQPSVEAPFINCLEKDSHFQNCCGVKQGEREQDGLTSLGREMPGA